MQTHTAHGSRRRRRSQSATIALRDTSALRLAKLVAFVFLGLIILVLLGAKLIPDQSENHFMTAEQERACTRAYLSADAKLTAVLCDPDQRRAPDGASANTPYAAALQQ